MRKANYVTDDDTNIITMSAKHSQKCISCSKTISLIEKETYMCSRCKQYFCTECFPLFLDATKCPGSFHDEHEPIMVRITRSIKEYAPIGVSIDKLERNKESGASGKSSLKIISDNEEQNKPKTDNSKPKLKILDD